MLFWKIGASRKTLLVYMLIRLILTVTIEAPQAPKFFGFKHVFYQEKYFWYVGKSLKMIARSHLLRNEFGTENYCYYSVPFGEERDVEIFQLFHHSRQVQWFVNITIPPATTWRTGWRSLVITVDY